MVASVPQVGSRPLYWLSVLFLLTSFPSIRTLADGNMEAIVIAGVALLIYGYRSENVGGFAFGLLLATIKVQGVSLLVLIISGYAILTWPRQKWLKAGIITGVVIAISLLWRGSDWFLSVFGPNYDKYTGSIIDISVSAALQRLGFVPSGMIIAAWISILTLTLAVAWKTKPSLSRVQAGTFIAASLLLAPYASGNSALVLLAIAIIPLFQINPWLGGGLILLFNIPYFWSTENLYAYQSYYWTSLVFIVWVILNWQSISRHSDNIPKASGMNTQDRSAPEVQHQPAQLKEQEKRPLGR
jgi:hypothetical protein